MSKFHSEATKRVITKSTLFVAAAVGFMAGIFLASAVEIPQPVIFVGAAGAMAALAWQFLGAGAMGAAGAPLSRRNSKILPATFLLLGLFVGMWRLNSSHALNVFAPSAGQKQDFDAVIVADVDVRTDTQLLTVKPDGFDQLVLITLPLGGRYFYGDRIWVRGSVGLPKSSDDFDYAAYLEQKNIYAVMQRPRVIVLRAHSAGRVSETLLRIKALFIRRISRILQPVEANLLLGILIGARKALPDDVIENFSVTGTNHIIAISGYNISIIVIALERFAAYFGRRITAALSVFIIMAFVVISGASASVVRAAIMGGLLILSFNIGRLYAVVPSLCAAAAIMLFINPKILYWDAGFQLSFLATVGIVALVPPLNRLTEKWPNPLEFKSIIITTLAASLATGPLVAHQFGRVSIIGPIVNLLVLPLVPMTMLFGFLAVLPGIGLGFGLLAHWLLFYMLWITKIFAGVPHAGAEVQLSALGMAAWYGGIVIAYFVLRWADNRRAPAAPAITEESALVQLGAWP